MYKLFVFDLDGTLVDSLGIIARTFNSVLRRYGLPSIQKEKFNYFAGDGPAVLVRRAIEYLKSEGRVQPGEEEFIFQGVYPDYLETYDQLKDDLTKPYAGIEKVLCKLKEENRMIAICTNKRKMAAENLVESVFSAEFDYISALEDGISRKPEPDMLNVVMEKLGVSKEEVLYFGDTNTDMKTGKNAAVDTVGVTWGFREREELEAFQPQAIIDHPKEILNFLDK